MKKKKLDELKSKVNVLEETAEGQLRGGFAVIGGEGDSPLDINNGCTNNGCNYEGCSNHSNNGCTNNGCNSKCPTTTKEDGTGSRFIGGGIAF